MFSHDSLILSELSPFPVDATAAVAIGRQEDQQFECFRDFEDKLKKKSTSKGLVSDKVGFTFFPT